MADCFYNVPEKRRLMKCSNVKLPDIPATCNEHVNDVYRFDFANSNLIYKNGLEFARIISIDGNRINAVLPNGQKLEFHVGGISNPNSTIGGKPTLLDIKELENELNQTKPDL